MRTKYLVAILIATFAGGAWFAVHSVQSQRIDLTSAEQLAPPATQVAVRLAESVDPFLSRSGG
jgi:hypothetical protein